MASQALPWPGKLGLAGDIAASQAREVERGILGRTALTLEARVRNAWYDLVLARAIDRIIDDRRAAPAQIEESVRERYAAGIAVQQDVLSCSLRSTSFRSGRGTRKSKGKDILTGTSRDGCPGGALRVVQ